MRRRQTSAALRLRNSLRRRLRFHKLDAYKVTMTQPVTRKLDEAAWAKVAHLVPDAMRPVKTKIEADGTGCKYLAQNEPKLWAKIVKAFETKPGKIGVKVEAV